MPAPQRPGFGRLIAPDRNDKRFPLITAVDPTAPIPEERIWSFLTRDRLNQRGGTCVGHGWAHALACAPYRHRISPELPYDIYNRAQRLDEWEGEDYEGTSVRAGAKACLEMGLIQGEYRWAFSEEVAWRYLMTVGPLVIGVTWLTGMLDIDKKGFINLTGGEEGGHCVCLRGGNRTISQGDYYNGIQSWPTPTKFKLRREDFKVLLEDLGGECASFTEVAPA